MSRSSAGIVSVSITAYGLWQMKLGTKNLEFKLNGQTLRDLVEALAKMDGKDFIEDVLTPQGRLADGLKVFVNGISREDISTRIENGDDVVLFSVFDGG